MSLLQLWEIPCVAMVFERMVKSATVEAHRLVVAIASELQEHFMDSLLCVSTYCL